MQKFPGHCAAVLGRVIFIGFGIQIALGVLWMCNAAAGWDSLGAGIVCVGQMLALGMAVVFCRGRRQGKFREFFAVLSVLTFPMVMQCLVTPDVRVLTAALLLAQTRCLLYAEHAPGRRELLRFFGTALCLWLAAGLIRGEYLLFGMVPVLLCLLRLYQDRRGHVFRLALMAMAAAGIIFGAGSFYRERGDMLVRMAERVSWTTLYDSYANLPDELRDSISYHRLAESTYEVTGIEKILAPSLEDSLGRPEAEKVLKGLIAVSWRDNRSRILKETAWDLAGYVMTPMVLPLQLQGRAYESYSGVNYRQVLQPAPRLGKLYMDYGCWWFAAALALRGILWLISAGSRADVEEGLLTASTVPVMALGYTAGGAGRMDYKNTLFILCVWLLWMTNIADGGNQNEDA